MLIQFWRNPQRARMGVIVLALLLRVWAAFTLPTDFDEPIYLQAAHDYARLLEAGDWAGVIDYAGNREHPPLIKLLYAGVSLVLGPQATADQLLLGTRLVSAIFGTLAVAMVAGIDPLAGLFLAIHTLAVKYTSQAYLEALPALTMLISLLALERWQRTQVSRWGAVSALCLGLTAAGKLSYVPVLLVVGGYWLLTQRMAWWKMAFWALGGLLIFGAFNPALWRDPVTRLSNMLFFHANYAQGADVQQAAYPWFQPFIWLATAPAGTWHPDVFFYIGFDGLFFWAMLGGLAQAWRDPAQHWQVVWVLGGVGVLLLWPTKWPQYTLSVLAPLCLIAAPAVRRLWHWLQEQETYWAWFRQMWPNPPRIAWYLLGAFILAFVGLYFYSVVVYILGTRGWAHLNRQNSPLPHNLVYATRPLQDGRLALATNAGLAVWDPSLTVDAPGNWQHFTPENSPLPHARVLALAQDNAGRLWVGTADGVSVWTNETWQTFTASDLGLTAAQVHSLLVDSAGTLWIGTQAGIAYGDGVNWTTLTTQNSELADDRVFALAQTPDGTVWVGTLSSLQRYDVGRAQWQSMPTTAYGPGAVHTLFVDSAARLWVGTQGAGASVWDGAQWQRYNTANSDLPFNAVNAVFEAPAGTFWFATARPLDVGGNLSSFDGQAWRHYLPHNSGFSGAEPLALSLDAQQRLWIATRTAGVDWYQISK